jgi:hypothetical protein
MVNPLLTGIISPADVPGCQLWYSADSLALANNDPIGSITDKSSHANNGSSSGAARPTFKTGIVNGLPVMRFAGAQYLAFTDIVKAHATWFVLWNRTIATNNDFVLGNVDNYYYLQYDTAWYVAGGANITVAHPATTFYLKCAKYDGANYGRYTNGVAEAPQVGSGGIDIAALGTINYVMYGDVAEFIIYDSALSDVDRQKVEAYLNNKYALW